MLLELLAVEKEKNYLQFFFLLFLKDFIYLFEKARAQVGARERGGEADSPISREPNTGLGSQDPGIMTWAEGRHLTNWATQVSMQVLF